MTMSISSGRRDVFLLKGTPQRRAVNRVSRCATLRVRSELLNGSELSEAQALLSRLAPSPVPPPSSPFAERSEPTAPSTSQSTLLEPIICSPGAGIFFFWQLGVMDYIQEHYDLTGVPFVGASAGGLLSALTCCGIQSKDIIRTAHRLALDHGVWSRSFGLAGIWGPIIRHWLDELLPSDAHIQCTGRVTVVITHVPTLSLRGISTFESKADLIEALMASAHVPFVIDGKPLASYRGELGMDGSFSEFFDPGTPSYSPFYDKSREAPIDLDYFKDKEALQFTRFEFLSLKQLGEVLEMYDKGYMYAHRLHNEGGNGFESLEPRRLKHPTERVSLPSLTLRMLMMAQDFAGEAASA